MEPGKPEKPKPVKKTVTFGTVESCEDTFLPLKKLPSKNQAPLQPIIKKKSALKQTEYSTFSSILKPAKLTDLSSKSSFDHQEGYLRKNLNPLSKPVNKFSQYSEGRCLSPPPRNASPIERESSNKFVLPMRSAHSSRVIKPNKKFIDGEDQTNITSSSLGAGKLLKKPKLKRVVFNNLHQDDDAPEEDEAEKLDNDKLREKILASILFKDKTTNSFSGLSGSRKLFSNYEKEPEYSQDENSNVEGLEKLKTVESHKYERAGHALRKLMDISDASSTSSTSSGSESEESWDSESATGSGEEEEKPPPSPEREKVPASQLLSGKVIIREARLQLNPPAPLVTEADGPFSTFTPTCSSLNLNIPVTCGVCGAVRFYKFVKQARKFGIYSCESCRKFISKMIKKEKISQTSGPIVMHCLKREGNCHVPPIVRSQQWKFKRCANKSRCPACWLQKCLKAFQVPATIRTGLTAMLPPYMRASAKPSGPLTQVNPLRLGASNALTGQPMFGALTGEGDGKAFTLKTGKKADGEPVKVEAAEATEKEENPKKEATTTPDETNEEFSLNRKRRLQRVKVRKKDKTESKDAKQVEDPKRQKVELKGPRVKHVCRSASIVLGQPIATFPDKDKDKSDDDSVAIDKDVITPDETIICDTEMEENKPPQTVPEVTVGKEVEETIEAKKCKVDAVPKVVGKGESSEDETVMELVPRKTFMKPLSNITNSTGRGRTQKCDQNRAEVICVDFWESYDPDEVCSSGFGLIGSAPFPVARLCFLCGSAGQEKMLNCYSCCEWYHSWCAEEPAGGAGWACARCVACAGCGRGAARARCRVCARHYHDKCLPPPPSDRRSDWPKV